MAGEIASAAEMAGIIRPLSSAKCTAGTAVTEL
jgi:hypothetical protein